MAQNKANRLQAKIGLHADVISKIDNIVDGIDAEFFSDPAIYNYLRCRLLEKKHANNPDVEMKSRIDGRLHFLKQEGRGMGIRRANSEEREVLPPPALHVSPTPSSIGTMISGLLGGSGNP